MTTPSSNAAILPLPSVWTDRGFRQRLRTEPRAGLRQLGIELPPRVQVKTIACKGSPLDVEDASLLQFLLECEGRCACFFLASPRSPCAQQAAFGKILSRELDDPVFDDRLRAAAADALRRLEPAA
jgi:Tfp pilus assembly protein PilN